MKQSEELYCLDIGDCFQKKNIEQVIAVGGKKGIVYIFPFSIM